MPKMYKFKVKVFNLQFYKHNQTIKFLMFLQDKTLNQKS
jgi:hypothetical protein